MSAYRAAGALLLLTAVATAISVLFRVSGGVDQTPMAESLGQSMGLDAELIAQLAAAETLSAIGAAKSAYAAGGAARLAAGLAHPAVARCGTVSCAGDGVGRGAAGGIGHHLGGVGRLRYSIGGAGPGSAVKRCTGSRTRFDRSG